MVRRKGREVGVIEPAGRPWPTWQYERSLSCITWAEIAMFRYLNKERTQKKVRGCEEHNNPTKMFAWFTREARSPSPSTPYHTCMISPPQSLKWRRAYAIDVLPEPNQRAFQCHQWPEHGITHWRCEELEMLDFCAKEKVAGDIELITPAPIELTTAPSFGSLVPLCYWFKGK